MAKQNKPRKQHAVLEREGGQEVVGIALILVGLLLFCSLLRFTPVDFVDWVVVGSFAPEGAVDGDTRNLIGPIGALIGLVFIGLFGAAAYLVAAGTIWLGIAVAWFKSRLGVRTMIGFGVLMLASASLFNVLGLFKGVHFGSWSGGVIGEGLGQHLFTSLLGQVGSAIILIGVYLASLILLTGWHPVAFVRSSYQSSRECYQEWRANRSGKVDLVATAKKKAGRKSKKEDELVSKEVVGVEEDGQAVLPLRETPTPQIIDSSQKRTTPIAGARPFERKKPTHTGLSTEGFEDYELPGFDLLEFDEDEAEPEDFSEELLATQTTIIETCRAFGVEVTAGDITRGPTITRYEIYPAIGLRVSRITQLEADLARATKAERINILAPIPGKDTVGIEIANDSRVAVALRELLQDEVFRSSKRKIPLALGKDVYGNTVVGDLAAMPHCLVAGATGAGKSVCINSIITSILYKFGPDELRFIMIDPKVVEMQVYAKLPHLVVPVVTDPKRVVGALNWCVNEMERRYKIFAKLGVRNFDSFNARVRPEEEVITEQEQEDLASIVDEEAIESMAKAFEDGDIGPIASEDDEVREDELEVPDRFPYIVVIIDELADLMQTAPADVEGAIARIAQKARAAGIHLIVATQTPRADVVTGIIKANIPSRIAFQVSSSLDSRVILDNKGAEKLVGKGDMLFLPPGSAKLERAQGAFVSDEEVEQIVNFCANQSEQKFEESIQKVIESGGSGGDGREGDVSDADEETLERCIEVLRAEGKASTSLLQRRLRLGYTRAARMIDILETRGIVGPGDGAKPREVLLPGCGTVPGE
ncbi:MAG: S-DNA-T family DNA segregation ATPase FtsK/SpoIIIE [Akkermansiaceae bacterium]|jgi:S-DNA-T family DNA segregation ATPase FtsK/SpoIIIE